MISYLSRYILSCNISHYYQCYIYVHIYIYIYIYIYMHKYLIDKLFARALDAI